MKNKRVIILVAVLAFLAAVLVLREILFRPGQKLALVTTEPAIYQTNIDPNLERIIFQFNQNVTDYDFSINVFPDFSYQSEAKNDQLIIVLEEFLTGQTKYLVEIREASTSFYFPLEFVTSLKEETNDQAGLGDPEAEEEIAKIILDDYPLFYQTPKKTDSWQADYSQKLEITVSYQASANRETVQQEVFAWMKLEGIDPQSHTLKWLPTDN